MTDDKLRATCVWCGVSLVAEDGTWTDHAGSGDYCEEGRAVGPTGTSPHLPALAAAATDEGPGPMTGEVPAGWLDYDERSGEYVLTERLANGDFGACSLLYRFARPAVPGALDVERIAADAIGLFLEYRDTHGHEEHVARVAAVAEVIEGVAALRSKEPT